jgi:DNA repair protein RAD16
VYTRCIRFFVAPPSLTPSPCPPLLPVADPWWNPAAEYQAIDRAHRLGQHKPIRAVRFVVRNTVEERILRLQDKKRLVFEGTVGGDAAALGQLSEEDLKFLFQN